VPGGGLAEGPGAGAARPPRSLPVSLGQRPAPLGPATARPTLPLPGHCSSMPPCLSRCDLAGESVKIIINEYQ